MKLHQWDINTRTQVISLGPALLLTVLLTAFFTFVRLQDLREELNHTGQLIANQLAPAAERGVLNDDEESLKALTRATLSMPSVQYVEIQDSSNNPLTHVQQAEDPTGNKRQLEIFQAPIHFTAPSAAIDAKPVFTAGNEGYLGRVLVGMSRDTFNQRQQEILFKAGLLAFAALLFTFLLARGLALSLSRPISEMGEVVKAIQKGDYHTPLPVTDDAELGALARHINNLAANLEQASLEQQHSMAQLIHTREQAEQANKAKSDFLAMMSHELRTPMNGVLGMLQLMETTTMTAEQAEYTTLAAESTEHLLKVINDILDFSRIERDALQIEGIAFNIAELIQSSTQAFNPTAQQQGLVLDLQLQAGIEQLEVLGDPTRIRQILVNLIGNALKFTEIGGVRVEAGWRALDGDQVRIICTVHDSGIGIRADRLESMFNAFQQADSSISRRYGGTGLGLSIARTLAERMGGSLHAHSEEGAGSVFTLELNLPRTTGSQAQHSPTVVNTAELNGERCVLLVEDNPVNRTVVEAMLHSLGFSVDVAVDGAEAVYKAQAAHHAVILMDCRLPIMDGYEATRRIRQIEGLEQVPIIALTANALHGDRDACLQAGMNDYLSKPFKQADLHQVLLRWQAFQPLATGDK
ncbi:response regulator [Pseudomonas sp. 21LCFQ02]|uniref:response regulator n=1 Tax=unclassified Pseudomonas TaxID=196821 RepID=UPI0004F58512|nr:MULTISPECIES: response regulator [unclassified Pseudomonas]MCO8170378.1 response regulator [Pseudomonas sp. 21LCFQ02]MCQ9425480.1 response regulator [Pseudomonas sp. LJDD11]BAP45605.1 sensor histidine kinase [Pseudomonas sp. StFLB209]